MVLGVGEVRVSSTVSLVHNRASLDTEAGFRVGGVYAKA